MAHFYRRIPTQLCKRYRSCDKDASHGLANHAEHGAAVHGYHLVADLDRAVAGLGPRRGDVDARAVRWGEREWGHDGVGRREWQKGRVSDQIRSDQNTAQIKEELDNRRPQLLCDSTTIFEDFTCIGLTQLLTCTAAQLQQGTMEILRSKDLQSCILGEEQVESALDHAG